MRSLFFRRFNWLWLWLPVPWLLVRYYHQPVCGMSLLDPTYSRWPDFLDEIQFLTLVAGLLSALLALALRRWPPPYLVRLARVFPAVLTTVLLAA